MPDISTFLASTLIGSVLPLPIGTPAQGCMLTAVFAPDLGASVYFHCNN